ncbi:hypothetical protein [Hyphomicrobium sp.]|uniref:hypothetical protein n=1 Tax=Hyphomicrobium sp. TaxID=82 RepID=UPI002FE179BB
MITKLFPETEGVVSRVSVQISEYSERNGGAEEGMGTLFAVEVLFPDGKWSNVGYFKDLDEARRAAENEAAARGADMLSVSCWPNRQVQAGV